MSRSHSSEAPTCCPRASAELKLYQTFIFSVPILFTFILLFLFYSFYLRRRNVDWSSLRMRTTFPIGNDSSTQSEMGLKKELREMLPIIVYKESFSIRDTQCSVCLGEYQADDRLQQIPACGHAFHMYCIDHWLATHTTCPLCRHSILEFSKIPAENPTTQAEISPRSSNMGSTDEAILHTGRQTHEETKYDGQFLDLKNRDHRNLSAKGEESSSQGIDR